MRELKDTNDKFMIESSKEEEDSITMMILGGPSSGKTKKQREPERLTQLMRTNQNLLDENTRLAEANARLTEQLDSRFNSSIQSDSIVSTKVS